MSLKIEGPFCSTRWIFTNTAIGWNRIIWCIFFFSKSCFTKFRDGAKMTESPRVAVRGPETQKPSGTEPNGQNPDRRGNQPKLGSRTLETTSRARARRPEEEGRACTCGGTAGSGSGSAGPRNRSCLRRRGVRLLLADPRESAPAHVRARDTATSVLVVIIIITDNKSCIHQHFTLTYNY